MGCLSSYVLKDTRRLLILDADLDIQCALLTELIAILIMQKKVSIDEDDNGRFKEEPQQLEAHHKFFTLSTTGLGSVYFEYSS